MDDFLKLKDGQGEKYYGYVATRKADSVYDIDNIEYEIVLEGEGVISNGNWDKIVGDIKVYDMKGVKTTITNWTQYIVFVFRATRDSGATEIKVNYINDGVFSPQKKEEKEKEKEKKEEEEKEKREEEVREIVLKAEPVSGQDNKYKLFFKFPTSYKNDLLIRFRIFFKKDVDDFDITNTYALYPGFGYGTDAKSEGNKDFLFQRNLENDTHRIGQITIGNNTTISDYIGESTIETMKDKKRHKHENIKFQYI